MCEAKAPISANGIDLKVTGYEKTEVSGTAQRQRTTRMVAGRLNAPSRTAQLTFILLIDVAALSFPSAVARSEAPHGDDLALRACAERTAGARRSDAIHPRHAQTQR